MDRESIENQRLRWLQCVEVPSLVQELQAMDDHQAEDAFYRHLAFGTGGLRGTMGAGTNRMNRYVVARATQGLAAWLLAKQPSPSVVIGYDSRLHSREFAEVTAQVLAGSGVQVHIWPRLLPVPTVSFGVRALGADAGVMITASHNPSAYNGYKVYGADGCQITGADAKAITGQIDALDMFDDVHSLSFEEGLAQGIIRYIPETVLDDYLQRVKDQSVLFGDAVNRDLNIVYTPLNGSGLEPVTRVLQETGFKKITVVEGQRAPDGHFPTCPYPNPQIREAMQLGIETARRVKADLLLATDPDCDRVGIAVRQADDYVLLTGNETGMLLLDFICSQRVRHGKMPEDPVMMKTIVTIDQAARIAAHYGVQVRDLLTGFKYIGEQIGELERQGRTEDYIFGFEESYGYLSGTYVRDKDGVNAALLICEMFAYYASQGVSLTDRLDALRAQYGYCVNSLRSFEFKGSAGAGQMERIMDTFRNGVDRIGGLQVIRMLDYGQGLNGLPRSNVLKFMLAEECSVVVRPSGTEPKLKLYLSVTAADAQQARSREEAILQSLNSFFS